MAFYEVSTTYCTHFDINVLPLLLAPLDGASECDVGVQSFRQLLTEGHHTAAILATFTRGSKRTVLFAISFSTVLVLFQITSRGATARYFVSFVSSRATLCRFSVIQFRTSL